MTVLVARAGAPARAAVHPAPALAAVAVGLTVTGLLTVQAHDAWSLSGAAAVPVDAAIGVAYPITGALVLRGNRALGRVFLAVGLAAALVTLTTAVAVTASEPSWWVTTAAWVQSWLWVPAFFPLMTLLPLLYPDGRALWRWTVPVAVVGTALLTAGIAVVPEPFEGRITVDKPFGSMALTVPLVVSGGALLAVSAVAGLASLVVRLRTARGLARRQVVVFLVAAAVVIGEVLAQSVLPAAVAAVSQPVAVVLLPVAVGIAVTRHRLYDLDLALLRALVGLSLVVSLAGAYLTVFALLTAVAPSLALPLAAGVTGLVVQPLGVRLARAGDRMYYGDRADPYAVLAGLSARLSDGSVADVPGEVCSAVVSSLRLRAAELLVADRSVGLAGTPDGPQELFALRHRGEDVGRFVVTVRPGERELEQRDRELLQALADAAAPALSALRLQTELQASREALVAGREEERRRLRRDLHDGVGAALAGARLQLESARDLVDHPLAGRMIDAAGSAVAEAVDDVRRLTDDLRPPALDELGLAGCLRALADRVRTPALDARTDVVEVSDLPAAVEVACYRIAGEALNNAARHAGASYVLVRLEHGEAGLVLEVTDDGRGLPEQRRAGVGLTSMRQRAEEIGGRLVVTTGKGTTVRAELPT